MKKIAFILAILSFSVLVSCRKKDSDSGPAKSISANNAGAVSSGIKIENSVRKSGNPPAPSIDPQAPKLHNDNKKTYAIGGRRTSLTPEIDISYSDIKGIYLKVVGAGDYFDIPYTGGNNRTSTGARVMGISTGNDIVYIEIPSNISEGTFCVEYCVYDAQNRVSNIITKCIEVSTIGGNNAGFLLGKWEITEFEDSNGKINLADYDFSFFPNTFCPSDDTTWVPYYYPCGDTVCDGSYYYFGYKEDSVEVNVHSKVKWLLEFAANGGTTYDIDVYSKLPDPLPTYPVCGGEVEITSVESYKDFVTGAWSYKEDEQKLVLVYDLSDEGYEDPWAIELKIISKTADKMVLEWDDENELFSYTFVKK